MPCYEYECAACGKRYEKIQSIKAEPSARCDLCGEEKARRLISTSSFLLKGSGWYGTDYNGKSEH